MTPQSFRKRHKLTQAALADLLQVNIRTVGRWEQTEKYPRWLAASLAALPVAPAGRRRAGTRRTR